MARFTTAFSRPSGLQSSLWNSQHTLDLGATVVLRRRSSRIGFGWCSCTTVTSRSVSL
jgi:hypothetical protein